MTHYTPSERLQPAFVTSEPKGERLQTAWEAARGEGAEGPSAGKATKADPSRFCAFLVRELKGHRAPAARASLQSPSPEKPDGQGRRRFACYYKLPSY